MIVMCAIEKVFICKKCNTKSDPIIFPIALMEISKLSTQFRKAHKGCYKENCLNCKHLEWYEVDIHERFRESGYFCEKRLDGVDQKEENRFLKKLNTLEFRKRQRACHEQGEIK